MPDVTRRGFMKGLSALVAGLVGVSSLEIPEAKLAPGPAPNIGVFNAHAPSGVLSVSEMPVHDHGRLSYASFHGIDLKAFANLERRDRC